MLAGDEILVRRIPVPEVASEPLSSEIGKKTPLSRLKEVSEFLPTHSVVFWLQIVHPISIELLLNIPKLLFQYLRHVLRPR
jgi:hypothetical protein